MLVNIKGSPSICPSSEIGNVTSRERQWDGRFYRLVAGALCVFFLVFVSVGLDGREQQQPQYQAPLSLSTDRIDRGGGCLHAAAAAATAPAAAPAFVVERGESFLFFSHLSQTDIFFFTIFYFFSSLCFLFFVLLRTRIPTLAVGLGIKASRGVQMYSLHEGSGLFLLAVLAGLQVNVILFICSGSLRRTLFSFF